MLRADPPEVSNVTPKSYSTTGGEEITIFGSNFTGTTAVSIGPYAAASFNEVADFQVTAILPVMVPGPYYVSVTTAEGTNTNSFNNQIMVVGNPYAYITANNSSEVYPIPVLSNLPETPISIGTSPERLAITPDGRFAYILDSGTNEVLVFDITSRTQVDSVPTGGTLPYAIAITPDGSTAYVVNQTSENVTPIDIATNTAGTLIALPAGSIPTDISISTNGLTAYVVNSGLNSLSPITLPANTVGTAIPIGSSPWGIAVTPDGTTAYVSSMGSNTVIPLDLGTNTPGTPIAVGPSPRAIAIRSNNLTAYVLNSGDNTVTPIDITTNTAGSPTNAISSSEDIAISPIQALFGVGYVTSPLSSEYFALIISGNVLGDSRNLFPSNPFGVAFVPEPSPIADFFATPASPGNATSFNAQASLSPVGGFSNYAWDFGDGNIQNTTSSTINHVYNSSGPFNVILTVTTQFGTSNTVLFTGKTVSNDGQSFASVTKEVIIPPAPAPTVTNVNPNTGPTSGGTVITITGTNFYDVQSVAFGLSPAASYVVNSDTSITATTPAHVAGVVDVRVTNLSGISPITPNDNFTFLGNPPTVTNLNPNSGPTTGGGAVTLTGTNFTGATSVTFGANPALFVINNSTTITATAPDGSVGSVNVIVENADGPSAADPANLYTYTAVLPIVTSVSPNSGLTSGGEIVTISGSNFTGATSVFFGLNAAIFVVNNDNTITATAPLGSEGTVHVIVTNADGPSTPSVSDEYTYIALPTTPAVSSISPTSGTVNGGIAVSITGSNFTGATNVLFGTTPATSFIVETDNSIIAIAPPGVPGTVTVFVVTPSGISSAGPDTSFTYFIPQPLPPSDFAGKAKRNKFATQTEYFNLLTWVPSPDPTVVSYEIYEFGTLIAVIPASGPTFFENHNLRKNGVYEYTLYSVNGSGIKSDPVFIVVTP